MVTTSNLPKKKISKKLTRTSFYGIIVIIFLLFFATHFYQGFKTLHIKEKQLMQLKEKIQACEAEYQRLVAISSNLDSEEYIERIAREQLGMVKKGEILIIPLE